MNTLALRILLVILLLFGISTCLMARLNDVVLLNLSSVYEELASEETENERHAELVQGLRRGLDVRTQTNQSIWWVGLGTAIVACLAITLRPNGD